MCYSQVDSQAQRSKEWLSCCGLDASYRLKVEKRCYTPIAVVSSRYKYRVSEDRLSKIFKKSYMSNGLGISFLEELMPYASILHGLSLWDRNSAMLELKTWAILWHETYHHNWTGTVQWIHPIRNSRLQVYSFTFFCHICQPRLPGFTLIREDYE